MTDAERIAELEAQLAYERANARIFMDIAFSWGSKNCELRRLLREHGLIVSQEPDGL